MSRNEIMEKLQEVFKEVFDNADLTVGDATTAKDVAGWDSLVHLSLITSIEEAFEIEFSLGEINKFQNVGEMVDSIEKHLSK